MDAVNSLVFAVIEESLPEPQSPAGFCLTMADGPPPLPYNPHRHGVEAWWILQEEEWAGHTASALARVAPEYGDSRAVIMEALVQSQLVRFDEMQRGAFSSLRMSCATDDLSWEQSGGLE